MGDASRDDDFIGVKGEDGGVVDSSVKFKIEDFPGVGLQIVDFYLLGQFSTVAPASEYVYFAPKLEAASICPHYRHRINLLPAILHNAEPFAGSHSLVLIVAASENVQTLGLAVEDAGVGVPALVHSLQLLPLIARVFGTQLRPF